ncbi:MAG: dihydroorotate dehydrogenase electron transfer subunit [Candidatus Methanomethylophilaceae archaeon]|jgi:dihydroorotate dehydrogenase electron transfer subunit
MTDIITIKDVIAINPYGKMFTFDWNVKVHPGQFIMVWAPGMDEIPLSLSSTGTEKSIAFKIIGDDTKKLSEMKKGDKLRIRGPYGNGYTLDKKKKILVVGGGIGIAPLLSVIKTISVDAVFAARDKQEVEYSVPLAKEYCNEHWIATDDGSLGFHGNAVDLVKDVMKDHKYDMIIACGPEVMLYFLHRYCTEANIDCQMSLERYMKCGCGICGACMIDDQRVCADGPIFTGEQISNMNDFGHYNRNACGSLIKFR